MHQAVKGLNLAEAAGSRSAEARLASACSVAAGLLARHRLAEAYLRRAFAALEGPRTRRPGLGAAVGALYGIGVEALEEVRGGGGRDRAPARRPAAAGRAHRPADLGAVLPGRAAGGAAVLAALDRLGRQSGDTQVRSWAVAGHAVVGLRTGDLAEAAAALRRSAPAPEALLALMLGDRARAVEALRRALGQPPGPWSSATGSTCTP